MDSPAAAGGLVVRVSPGTASRVQTHSFVMPCHLCYSILFRLSVYVEVRAALPLVSGYPDRFVYKVRVGCIAPTFSGEIFTSHNLAVNLIHK